MKYRRSLICVGMAMACMSSAYADTLAKVAERNQITLAYRESSIPFSYLDGGKPTGMAVEISNAIAEAVKRATGKPDLKVHLQAVTSQNRIPLLVNGTIDLECGSTTNNTTRAKDVDFAINHFYTGTRLLVKKSSGIKNYSDLKGKTVAVTSGTTNLQVLRKANADNQWGFDVVMPKDHADAFLLVENDRAAAFGMDDILLYGLIANSKSPDAYEVVADSLQVEPYACMLRKDDPQFKALVNGVIGDLMKSGKFAELYDKWFMKPIPPANTALGLPMSTALKQNLTDLSDKPAF
ncbi:MAG TPA: amino acid ABC transporter substrate-binding protein [Comamonas sp.]